MAPKRTSPTKGARATAAAAAAARAPTLTAEGNSDSWESSKANQFRIANKFLEAVSDDALKDKWGLDWEKLPEEHACSPEIYQALASYLCQEYIIEGAHKNSGQKLGPKTALGVWSALINRSKDRFKAPTTGPEALAFFDCLKGDKSPQAYWYKGIKNKMMRVIFQRQMLAGESMDNSANSIYMMHVESLIQAYTKASTGEAIERAFSLLTLWLSVGRSSETGFLHIDGLNWEEGFKCVTMEIPQSKSGKYKVLTLVAGANRHLCWFLQFGDLLISKRGASSMIYKSGEPLWLCPSTQGSGAGAKLTSFVAGMQPAGCSGHLSKYAAVSVRGLPPNPTAAGFRPGAINTLACHVPAELAVHSTGHTLTGMSALWEYMSATTALCIPGAIVLAGWRPFPYGQMGVGPVPASLAPVLTIGGVSEEKLEAFADNLFNFHDASPPMLLKDGSLRPALHAALASLIMYYPERFDAGESALVLQAMRDSFRHVGLAAGNPHDKFFEWAKLIKGAFNLGNLHLTGGLNESGAEQIITSIKQLGSTFASVHAVVMEVKTGMSALTAAVSSASTSASTFASRACISLTTLTRRFACMPAPTAGDSSSEPLLAAQTPPLAPADPMEDDCDEGLDWAGGTAAAEAAAMMVAPPPIVAQWSGFAAPVTPAPTSMNGVCISTPISTPGSGTGAAVTGIYSFKQVMSTQWYLDCMANNGTPLTNLKSQDVSRGNLAFSFFKAMSTKVEVQILLARPRDEAAAVRTVLEVEKWVRKRIEAAYKKEAKAIGTKWPKSKLFVNSLEEKLKSVNIIMDSGAFQAFRAGAPIPNALPFQKRVVEESFSSAASPSKVPRAEIVISDDSDSD